MSKAELLDADGNTYLDFFAGVDMLNHRHNNPAVNTAVYLRRRLKDNSGDQPTIVAATTLLDYWLHNTSEHLARTHEHLEHRLRAPVTTNPNCRLRGRVMT